eukprot:1177791-Prymnesium_polylepis.2
MLAGGGPSRTSALRSGGGSASPIARHRPPSAARSAAVRARIVAAAAEACSPAVASVRAAGRTRPARAGRACRALLRRQLPRAPRDAPRDLDHLAALERLPEGGPRRLARLVVHNLEGVQPVVGHPERVLRRLHQPRPARLALRLELHGCLRSVRVRLERLPNLLHAPRALLGRALLGCALLDPAKLALLPQLDAPLACQDAAMAPLDLGRRVVALLLVALLLRRPPRSLARLRRLELRALLPQRERAATRHLPALPRLQPHARATLELDERLRLRGRPRVRRAAHLLDRLRHRLALRSAEGARQRVARRAGALHRAEEVALRPAAGVASAAVGARLLLLDCV